MRPGVDATRYKKRRSFFEVLWVFLRLGLTSFGGPVAHLGYFRAEFVARRQWLDEAAYADLIALCQFLPGPASSQVGFAIGMLRAGLPGGFAAWLGFTAPSALAIDRLRLWRRRPRRHIACAWLHGLKIVAVAVVAQAVWGMARTLCPDRERASSRSPRRCSSWPFRGERPDRRHRRWAASSAGVFSASMIMRAPRRSRFPSVARRRLLR